MDVSFNNVVESTRQYFQGVPTPTGSGQTGYGSAPYWYQQGQGGPEHHQQQQPSNRLPSLAPFSTLNYRGSGGNLPAVSSVKSTGQGSYDVNSSAARYPSPSGYGNYYGHQQQQQQQLQHHIQHQQSQQQQAQQQQVQIHQHQQQSHQHQQQSHQHQQQSHLHQQQSHQHQQQSQLQHHQQQPSSKEHQPQQHHSHQQNQQSQHITQQSSQSHQSHLIQKHQALQSHQQGLQNHHSSIQSHQQQPSHQGHQQSSLQSMHAQQGQQQVMANHHSQQQQQTISQHQVPPNHQNHQQNYQDNQQQNIHSHSQLLQLQSHKQVIQNHKMQLMQNQQAMHSLQQNHSSSQHSNNMQHQYPSHQSSQQSHHSHQMAMAKYQMQSHQSHHSSMQNQHQPVINQLQPSQMSHQQPAQSNQPQVARRSPLAVNQQHMTRQSPHHQGLPSHHQQTITRQSPHISSHQQTITRQSPHHQNLPSPSVLQQQTITRQSPLASPPVVAFASQPSSHASASGHQQGFFSTTVSGSRTTPTGSTAIPVINQVKRESPLDLSVKTIRQSADSTADPEHVFYTFHNEFLRGKASGSGHAQQPISASKVDFQPFTAPADGKKRKESYYTLPSVNSFSRAYDKMYQQQPTQQQLQRSGGLKAEARYSQNYLKRPSEPEKQQASPKVPRIDTWKQTFDQQIEKRFNSYLSSIGVNGEKKTPFASSSYPEQKQNGADKRVLSILRNSLETRNQQVNHPQPKQPPPAPRYLETRLPPSTVMRQNLPPFGALSTDRNRLQVPRAVDSIQRSVSSQDVVDITDDDEPPQQAPSKGELDGLAAFLAARIRTKAELKQQVTPSSKENNSKPTPTPSNASCSSGHSSPRTQVFSSADNKDLVKSFTSPEGSATGNKGLLWSVNAHRLSKENSLLSSLPRRRDSDSEGSDVVLTDLRRGSISSSSVIHAPPPPPPVIASPEEEEDFNKWIAVCDELVTQLQQGGKSIRKKFRRRLDERIFIKKEDESEDFEIKIKKELISDNSREGGIEDEEEVVLQQPRGRPPMNLKKIRQPRKPGPRKKKLKKLIGNWHDEVWQYKRPIYLMTTGEKWPKAPSSLPDLDRLNDPHPELPVKTEEDNKSVAKTLGEEKSFLDRLMQRYSDRRKKAKIYEQKDPQTSSSELSSTPKTEESNVKTETIAGFRDDLPAEGDLPPDIKPKIKETKLKHRDFNEERPASAPPPGATKIVVRKNNTLRNPVFVKKKKGFILKKGEGPRLIPEKRFKTFRRKLKSSGFDYIRKKKKQVVKREGEPPRERKKKTAPLTEQEIQAEIKGWVLNKGLGETLLHRAARIGNVDVVYYCLEKLHHNPAPRDNAGYTPLHVACSRGHFQVANLLLKYGANVSDSALGGVRPLHEAAENGFTKIVKLLLEHGADPQLATYSGATAMALATDEEARLLMEMHISNQVPLQPITDDDPTCSSQPKQEVDDDSGLASSDLEGFEIEESSVPLPNLYRLANEPRSDSWVLFHELSPLLRVKTKEALLKQLGQDARTVLRDMKTSEFYEKAHCRAIKSSAGPKTPKVTLVKYTDTVKFLLGVETTIIPR